MKVVLPGGTGHVGQHLIEHFSVKGWETVVLTRRPTETYHRAWDGRTLGDWAKELEGADLLVNLAGRSVNCRYTKTNLRQMMDSRVESTRVLGEAISGAADPPKVWMNSSTATIYAHRFDQANDETTGHIGGNEPDVPRYWDYSIKIAQAWEEAFFAADTPKTRKIALRSAMVMSEVPGSVFMVLVGLAKKGLLGRFGDGRQYVSWIHEDDFTRAIDFLFERQDLDGVFNLAAPEPRQSVKFNAILREAVGVKIGLPAPKWMLEIGAAVMGSDTELLLKSRNVVPGRLVSEGFEFKFPNWSSAAKDLTKRMS